jgi:mycoredoxin
LNDLYNKQPSQIVMYATEYCPDCHRAKAFFKANGIEYLLVGLEDNSNATNFIININDGNRSVPTIIFPDGTVLVEPSWEELRAKVSGA